MFGHRQWPDYFSVGLLNSDQDNNGVSELLDYKIVPLLRAEIDLQEMDY